MISSIQQRNNWGLAEDFSYKQTLVSKLRQLKGCCGFDFFVKIAFFSPHFLHLLVSMTYVRM